LEKALNQVRTAITALQGVGNNGDTHAVRIKAFMTSFFSYAVDELGILAANPALGKMPRIGRTDRAKTYAYLETETKQIRDAVRKHIAEEHRELASTLLTLGNYTSLSKSELAGLDWEDFDPVEKVLYVRRSRVEGKEGHTKTKARVRKQPLHGVSVQQLLHYKSKTLGTGLIFCGITGAFDRRPLNFKYFEKLLKAALQKENVPWHGWHAFRRAFATNLYHKDVKEVTVQSLMGHKKGSTITREHYIQPQDDSAKAAVTLLN
jgi:integrase